MTHGAYAIKYMESLVRENKIEVTFEDAPEKILQMQIINLRIMEMFYLERIKKVLDTSENNKTISEITFKIKGK